MPKKFCRVDQHLRIAVGLEYSKLPVGVTIETPGVADIRPYPGWDSQKVYLDLESSGKYDNGPLGYGELPRKFEVEVPTILGGAPWGEIIFNNNRTGAQVLFGREGEEMVFGPTEGKYVILRLYREQEFPFNPVYVRVDKGPETRFFVIKARWESNTITIEIEHEPQWLPSFLA